MKRAKAEVIVSRDWGWSAGVTAEILWHCLVLCLDGLSLPLCPFLIKSGHKGYYWIGELSYSSGNGQRLPGENNSHGLLCNHMCVVSWRISIDQSSSRLLNHTLTVVPKLWDKNVVYSLTEGFFVTDFLFLLICDYSTGFYTNQ